MKLCVGTEHQKALDSLYEKLTSHQLPAEQAVKQLMELVGSTVVQQVRALPHAVTPALGRTSRV